MICCRANQDRRVIFLDVLCRAVLSLSLAWPVSSGEELITLDVLGTAEDLSVQRLLLLLREVLVHDEEVSLIVPDLVCLVLCVFLYRFRLQFFKLSQLSEYLIGVLHLVYICHHRHLKDLHPVGELFCRLPDQGVLACNELVEGTKVLANSHQFVIVLEKLIDLVNVAGVCDLLHEVRANLIVVGVVLAILACESLAE